MCLQVFELDLAAGYGGVPIGGQTDSDRRFEDEELGHKSTEISFPRTHSVGAA
jgi:hypothetical protein